MLAAAVSRGSRDLDSRTKRVHAPRMPSFRVSSVTNGILGCGGVGWCLCWVLRKDKGTLRDESERASKRMPPQMSR